ncbi:DUF192 domain-containing protein [candidate division WWE3 bacterium]|uniref:DUF192 domain-containing protein n=1 Tax=candidate division WWE3 bacterium TaxID=2053526 RepID=A0A7X9DKN0_UNCKA|nr:DUF192 domain-containing protein [candidate division WWE3 bacterium]
MGEKLKTLTAKIKTIKPLYLAVGVAVIVILVLALTAVTTTLRQRQEATQKESVQKRNVKVVRVVSIGGKDVEAEIASTPQERIKGLMYRTVLEDGKGMLFTFGSASQYPFWMKNMKISIDIIWIGENMTVIDIDQNVPPCEQENCEYYTPASAAKYVLEVPAGWAQRNNVQTGNTVEFKESKQEFVD